MNAKVLIIEDDDEIVESISLAFGLSWPEARVVSTHLGRRGIEMVENENPDVVILDLGLPDINGFEVLHHIRLFSQVPIIILTVKTDEADVIKGLERGADEYVIKPFRQLELLARVKALIRRQNPSEGALVCGPMHLNVTTGELEYEGKEIALTLTESRILGHLMKNAGHIVIHSSLAEAVWETDYPGAADGLKVHIRRLREKIETDASHPTLILTKSGIGYYLKKP